MKPDQPQLSPIAMEPRSNWPRGEAPVAVVMISLNEGHNMEAVLRNLAGWAQEVFLVDSYSQDETVDIALKYGVHVVQRRFRGFGDQWNYALQGLPITAPWTMKLDPDERLGDELKASICGQIKRGNVAGIAFFRRLWFMGKPLPIKQEILRIWRTGRCRFSDVTVNEHPIVDGDILRISGEMEHHDSPDLHHWVEKQNRYSTLEALARYRSEGFAVTPRFLGTALERRMWFKKNFYRFPLRYQVLLFWYLIQAQPWATGYAGFAWARLRVWVTRLIEDKLHEMMTKNEEIKMPVADIGQPHPQAYQIDN